VVHPSKTAPLQRDLAEAAQKIRKKKSIVWPTLEVSMLLMQLGALVAVNHEVQKTRSAIKSEVADFHDSFNNEMKKMEEAVQGLDRTVTNYIGDMQMSINEAAGKPRENPSAAVQRIYEEYRSAHPLNEETKNSR